jgi:CheY-like chemotaxis protein
MIDRVSEPKARERGSRGRVLLIDDDERTRPLIGELLTRGGYEVVQLTSPIGATQIVAGQNISAVVVDVTSPAMHGPRFASLLASWERIRDLPVILLSDDSLEARQAVALVKQVSVESKSRLDQSLVRTLDKALAHRTAANPSQSGVVPVRPGVRHYARGALDAWRAFMAHRGVAHPTLVALLASLRAEVSAIGLDQTTELVEIALELAERFETPQSMPKEADLCVVELLEWLGTLEVDKGRAFDRSLAVTVHRARLEHARRG